MNCEKTILGYARNKSKPQLSAMSEELVRNYTAFSLTTMLMPTAPASPLPPSPVTLEAQQVNHITNPLPLASPSDANISTCDTQWSKMFNGMTKDRKAKVIGKAIQQVQELNYRGLRKGPLVAELRRGLKGVLPTSDSAKFFLMKAAFGCGSLFVFKTDYWHWPCIKPDIDWPSHQKWTVLKADGSIALETPKMEESVGVESPWHPLKARGAYKKPELMQMVRVLIGDVPPKAKVDELYAMLVGKLQPLGQP